MSNVTVASHLELGESAPSPLKPSAQQSSVFQAQSCRVDGRTSFADTLKAAAQLELKSPGLLAKLARHDQSMSNLFVSSVLSL